MKPTILLVVLLAAAMGVAQAPPAAQGDATMTRITALFVWHIPPTFLPAAHKACDNAPQPPSIAECFIGQMSKAGASPAAVAFTHRLFEQNGGEVAIMTGFNRVGPVDVAFITYPFRANTNNGILFVNGTPRTINAEDLKLLDQAAMEQSPQFQNTKAQFPKVSLWPGDRDGTTWPNPSKNPDGSTSFTLGYPLLNGCHACERAGFAQFNWNFSRGGKFLGTTFMGMTPPPVQ